MYSVLVIEDALETQFIIKTIFEKNRSELEIELTLVDSKAHANEKIATQHFDIILLDLNLPDGDGIEFYQSLQNDSKTKDIPVIVISARKDSDTKVKGFALGIEDYVEKPFHPQVLHARVLSKLKKLNKDAKECDESSLKNLQVDKLLQRVYLLRGGKKQDIGLTPMEFNLFLILSENRGKIFHRDELLHLVWGETADTFDRTVDRHICSMRKKLGPIGQLFRTAFKKGYFFEES